MPPNLALLVDFDEHTKQIGPTLFKRIHDPHWEVQDSVLEILNKIACLSENSKHIFFSFFFFQIKSNVYFLRFSLKSLQ